jgi:AcrR family transcriptional regulator
MELSSHTTRTNKKTETRQKLFDSARHLFSCHAYESVKIEDITKEAGLAKGTFFNYFESKEAIVYEMQYFVSYDSLMPILSYEGPIVPKIKQAIVELLMENSTSKSLMRAVLLSQLKDNRQLEKLAEQLQSFYHGMNQLVDKAKKQGEMRHDLDSMEIVRTVERMYMGILMQWCCDIEDSPLDTFIAQSFDVLFAGLQPQPTAKV